MGLLVEGKWVDEWYDTESTGGKFVRKDSSFRDWITRDGKIDDKSRRPTLQKQAGTTSMFPWLVHGQRELLW